MIKTCMWESGNKYNVAPIAMLQEFNSILSHKKTRLKLSPY